MSAEPVGPNCATGGFRLVSANGTAYVCNGQNGVDATAPTGSIVAFAGTDPPTGWLLCDGAELAQASYPNLFSVIRTTFGSSTDSTFKLPDLRGRFPLGAGAGPGLTARTVAQQLGAEVHTLTVAEMPPHSHTGQTGGVNVGYTADPRLLDYNVAGSLRGFQFGGSYASGGGEFNTHQHSVTTNSVGGGQPHDIMPPSVVINYIIKQ